MKQKPTRPRKKRRSTVNRLAMRAEAVYGAAPTGPPVLPRGACGDVPGLGAPVTRWSLSGEFYCPRCSGRVSFTAEGEEFTLRGVPCSECGTTYTVTRERVGKPAP